LTTSPLWYGHCLYLLIAWTGLLGFASQIARGRNRQEGRFRRRGITARERNRLSEQKLARSAHLPQKLATQVVFARLGRSRVTPFMDGTRLRPVFFGVAK
jgi:hypothetical protein